MSHKRGSAFGTRRMVRRGYQTLSVLNTVSILLTFDPFRIMRHFMRKGILRWGSRLWR